MSVLLASMLMNIAKIQYVKPQGVVLSERAVSLNRPTLVLPANCIIQSSRFFSASGPATE